MSQTINEQKWEPLDLTNSDSLVSLLSFSKLRSDTVERNPFGNILSRLFFTCLHSVLQGAG